MTTYEQEHAIRKANRPRIDGLDEHGLRDVVSWLNGHDPDLLSAILDDLDEEWER